MAMTSNGLQALRLWIDTNSLNFACNMKRPYIQNKKELTEKLLLEQCKKCYYCNIPFNTIYDKKVNGDWVTKWTKPILDHIIPYSYTHSHISSGFVLSCEICNSIKSDKIPTKDTNIIDTIMLGWNKALKQGKLRILKKDVPEDCLHHTTEFGVF